MTGPSVATASMIQKVAGLMSTITASGSSALVSIVSPRARSRAASAKYTLSPGSEIVRTTGSPRRAGAYDSMTPLGMSEA